MQTCHNFPINTRINLLLKLFVSYSYSLLQLFFGNPLEEKWFYPCSSLEFTSLNSATKVYKTLKRFIHTWFKQTSDLSALLRNRVSCDFGSFPSRKKNLELSGAIYK